MNTRQVLNKFIEKGIMQAELNEFFSQEFRDEVYSGMEMKPHELPVQITIRVNKTHEVIGDRKARLNRIKHVIMERFPLLKTGVEINVEMVKNKGLCPNTQAEYIKSKLIENIPFRRAVNSVLRSIKDAGAQGCAIIVSGKLKGQRAKSVKYTNGLLIHTGASKNDYVKEALSVVHMKQGVIGIKIKIMLPYDPEGICGPSKVTSDRIRIFEPKELY